MTDEDLKPKTADEVFKDIKKEDFVTTDKEGKDPWHGTSMQAESTPLVDPGVGNPTIVRTFMFAANPEFLKKNKGLRGISKQELFNNHWKLLELELWKDGLIPDESVSPKIIFKRKHYLIQIVCKARLGVFVVDNPRNLQDYMRPKSA